MKFMISPPKPRQGAASGCGPPTGVAGRAADHAESTSDGPGALRCTSLAENHHAMAMGKSTNFRLGHFQVRKLFVYQGVMILMNLSWV